MKIVGYNFFYYKSSYGFFRFIDFVLTEKNGRGEKEDWIIQSKGSRQDYNKNHSKKCIYFIQVFSIKFPKLNVK